MHISESGSGALIRTPVHGRKTCVVALVFTTGTGKAPDPSARQPCRRNHDQELDPLPFHTGRGLLAVQAVESLRCLHLLRNPSVTLEELADRFDQFQPGESYPVVESRCRYCGSVDLVVQIKLEAVPGALAGVQIKTSARKIAVLECRGCGHVSGS